jgi:hypothetical protein
MGGAFGFNNPYYNFTQSTTGSQMGTPNGQQKAFGGPSDFSMSKTYGQNDPNPYGGIGDRFQSGQELGADMRQQGWLFSQKDNPYALLGERSGPLDFNFGEGGPIENLKHQKVEGVNSAQGLFNERANALNPLRKIYDVFGQGSNIGAVGTGGITGGFRFQRDNETRVADISREQASKIRNMFTEDPTEALRGAFNEASQNLIDRGVFDSRDQYGLQGMYTNILNSFQNYGLL